MLGLFSFEEAEKNANWFAEEWGNSLPESEEYGISSFVFREHYPFHPQVSLKRVWVCKSLNTFLNTFFSRITWLKRLHDALSVATSNLDSSTTSAMSSIIRCKGSYFPFSISIFCHSNVNITFFPRIFENITSGDRSYSHKY